MFQVSPGVEIREVDLTNVVPAVSTSIGAVAGAFEWGPVGQIVTVGSEKGLVDTFGEPTAQSFKYFMPAAQFLQYSNSLKVVRADVDGALNATPDGAGLLIKNTEDYETKTFSAGQEFIAKYPGELGNSITVHVVSSAAAFESATFTDPGYADLFDFAPGTTDFADSRGAIDDEIHVLVVDSTGEWTGTPGDVLEVFQGLSQASNAKKSDGTTNYYVDVINQQSRYIWAGAAPSTLTNAGDSTSSTNLTTESDGNSYETDTSVLTSVLSGGTAELDAVEVGDLQSAYDYFLDSETVDINLIVGVDGGADAVTLANYLIGIAESRKDAVAFVSPAVSDTVNALSPADNVKAFADQVTSSSYGVIDSTALYVYDKFNDTFRYIVAAGTVAGLCAYTDDVADPWFSPAGFNRGQLRGVTKVAFNPIKAERDTLYKARVNPIVAFPGEGIVLFGDKTAQAKPSAFDRINVRRLFITLEKAVSTAARFQLFELNDEFTRAQFRNLIEPFLRNVQGRRGVTDFRVVCDETNNTSEVVDTNRFVADIYIKPARSINFITLNFIAVRSGVEFSEIAG